MSGIIATPSNEMPPEPREVPYDILAEVIDILARTDHGHTNELKNISFVSPSCLHLCRKHLFRKITVVETLRTRKEQHIMYLRGVDPVLISMFGQRTNATPRDFITLVNDHPGVIPHIQMFRLINKTDDPEFTLALGRLTNLSRFEILWSAEWEDCLTRILHSMAHLPLLQTLKLQHVSRLPLAALAILPNIQHLQLCNVLICNPIDDQDLDLAAELAVTSTPVKPKSLTIEGSVVRDLLGSGPEGQVLIDWSGLSNIDFMTHVDQDAKFMTHFLTSLPTKLKSLQQLSVAAGDEVGFLKGSMDLHLRHVGRWIVPHRKTLTTLDFTSWAIPHTRGEPLKMGVYTAFCRALNALRETDNVLENLTMRINVKNSSMQRRWRIDREGWMELPDTLLRPGWRSLQVVSIGVAFSSDLGSDSGIRELREIFASCLHHQHFRYLEL